MSAIHFEFKLHYMPVIDPAAAGMLAVKTSDAKAYNEWNEICAELLKLNDVSYLCLFIFEIHLLFMNQSLAISFKLFRNCILLVLSFIVCLRGCPIQRGSGLSYGSTVASAQQSVQSQAQLHHLIGRSVSEFLDII